MALISCPDCGQQVSDAAPACPRCGRPAAANQMQVAQVVSPMHVPPGQHVQTVELTAKKWKGLQIAGFVVWLLSFMACIGGAADHQPNVIAGSALMFLVSVALWLGGRVGAWWHHK